VDKRLFLDVNSFARSTSWLHAIMTFWAVYGGLASLFIILAVSYLRARFGPDSFSRVVKVGWAGIGTLLALGISQIISHIVARPRPWQSLNHIELLVPRAHDYSFPSDHAIAAGAVLMGMILLKDKLLIVLSAIVALSLAFARVYVGTHYPGDVTAGLIIGALVSYIFYFPGNYILTKIAVAASKLSFIKVLFEPVKKVKETTVA
jgi:undecaprenyl-diphosphatase